MDDYPKILANRINLLCNQRGISIRQLSEMSGIKQSTLQNIIKHHHNTQLKNVHKIANAFCMTVSEFLDFEEMNNFSFD